jgi:ParB-like chromosome segregation protein Spo0J
MKRLGRRDKLGRASQGQTGVDCPVKVVYRPIDQLRPDPRNPRRHERKQIRKIADSIATFGFNVPILVDADLKVVAGHGRLLACRLLGREEVPTISLEHLSPAQARAFMIADNRLTEIAGWDDRLLGENCANSRN